MWLLHRLALVSVLVVSPLLPGCLEARPPREKMRPAPIANGISPEAYVKMLGVGMDVDWAKTGQGIAAWDASEVAMFKARGLRHVRIRVKDAADPPMLAHIEAIVDECLRQGLIPIIAYQAKEFKRAPGEQQLAMVAQWWDTVATRMRNKDARLAFDILIEPTEALNKDTVALNALYERAVTAIRRTNPTRNIFIAPRVRSNPSYLAELKWPSRANGHVLAEWHFYASGPSPTNPEKLWTNGNAAERAIIERKLQLALDWQRATGNLSWVGAWMPGNYNDGDNYAVAEQQRFATFVACMLRKGGIPYSVNSDVKFFDRDANRWRVAMAGVLDAVISPDCSAHSH